MFAVSTGFGFGASASHGDDPTDRSSSTLFSGSVTLGLLAGALVAVVARTAATLAGSIEAGSLIVLAAATLPINITGGRATRLRSSRNHIATRVLSPVETEPLIVGSGGHVDLAAIVTRRPLRLGAMSSFYRPVTRTSLSSPYENGVLSSANEGSSRSRDERTARSRSTGQLIASRGSAQRMPRSSSDCQRALAR